MRKIKIVAGVAILCCLISACSGVPQKVFIEEPSTEPIVVRKETDIGGSSA